MSDTSTTCGYTRGDCPVAPSTTPVGYGDPCLYPKSTCALRKLPEPPDLEAHIDRCEDSAEANAQDAEADDLMAEGYCEAAATNGFQDSPVSEVLMELAELEQESWNLYSLAGGAGFADARVSHDDILRSIDTLRAHITAQDAEIERLTTVKREVELVGGIEKYPEGKIAALRNALEGSMSVIRILRKQAERDAAVVEAAKELLSRWIDAQGFDPCGGPADDIDGCIVNAELVLRGELPATHPAVSAALSTREEETP